MKVQLKQVYASVLFALAVGLGVLNVYYRRQQSRDIIELPAGSSALPRRASAANRFTRAQFTRVEEQYNQRKHESVEDSPEMQQLMTVLIGRRLQPPGVDFAMIDETVPPRVSKAAQEFKTFGLLQVALEPLEQTKATDKLIKLKIELFDMRAAKLKIPATVVQIGTGCQRTVFADALVQRISSAFDLSLLLWDTNATLLEIGSASHKGRMPNTLRAAPSFETIATAQANDAIMRAKEKGLFSGSSKAATAADPSKESSSMIVKGKEDPLLPITVDAATRFVGAKFVAMLVVHPLDGGYDQLSILLSSNLGRMRPLTVLLDMTVENEESPMLALCRALLRRLAGYRQVIDGGGVLGKYELWESSKLTDIDKVAGSREAVRNAQEIAKKKFDEPVGKLPLELAKMMGLHQNKTNGADTKKEEKKEEKKDGKKDEKKTAKKTEKKEK